jgi:hypothetical protein
VQPAQCDIQVYRGDYFEMTLRLREGVFNNGGYTPGPYLVLTGWTPKAEIRANQDANVALATFVAVILDQTATPGGVHLSLPSAQSALLAISSAVWDVQLTDPQNRVYTYLRGTVTITKDVTRP